MQRRTRLLAAAAASLAALTLPLQPAAAQDWKPTQPIRVIVPYQRLALQTSSPARSASTCLPASARIW